MSGLGMRLGQSWVSRWQVKELPRVDLTFYGEFECAAATNILSSRLASTASQLRCPRRQRGRGRKRRRVLPRHRRLSRTDHIAVDLRPPALCPLARRTAQSAVLSRSSRLHLLRLPLSLLVSTISSMLSGLTSSTHSLPGVSEKNLRPVGSKSLATFPSADPSPIRSLWDSRDGQRRCWKDLACAADCAGVAERLSDLDS